MVDALAVGERQQGIGIAGQSLIFVENLLIDTRDIVALGLQLFVGLAKLLLAALEVVVAFLEGVFLLCACTDVLKYRNSKKHLSLLAKNGRGRYLKDILGAFGAAYKHVVGVGFLLFLERLDDGEFFKRIGHAGIGPKYPPLNFGNVQFLCQDRKQRLPHFVYKDRLCLLVNYLYPIRNGIQKLKDLLLTLCQLPLRALQLFNILLEFLLKNIFLVALHHQGKQIGHRFYKKHLFEFPLPDGFVLAADNPRQAAIQVIRHIE